MKKMIIFLLSLILIFIFTSCNKSKKKEIRNIEPFWRNSTMKNESILLTRSENGLISGNLMFHPKKIIKVSDSTLTKTYKENIDYVIEGNKIVRTENSSMPFLDEHVLYGINMPANQGLSTQPASQYGVEKGFSTVLYTETSFLFRQQIFVTYEYDLSEYKGYKQSYSGYKLPNTLNILLKKEMLNIVVYGDSVSTGCNASGSELLSLYDDANSQYISWNIEPKGKSFPELFADELSYKYGSEINLLSAGKGGTTSEWGKHNALTRVYNPDYGYEPDLVLLHFGLNDSSMFMDGEVFKQNIKQIIEDIRRVSPKTVEFILIGSMYANKDAIQYGLGTNYIKQLTEIVEELEGVIAVDVGAVHQAFLDNKKYSDMTANNVNHPNDFLHRLYAMVLNAALIKED